MYYTSLQSQSDLFDTTTMEYAFNAKSIEELESWKTAAKKRLWEITGMNLCRKTALDSVRSSVTEENGIQKEYRIINTEPGISMPFWLFRPKKPNGAAVIVPHSHGGGKDASLRLTTDGKNYVTELAERGYLVVCPDDRGSGERREFPQQGEGEEKNRSNSHREVNNIALGFGQAVIGLFVWDLMCMIDFLTGEEGIKPGKIACTGMSGGGQKSLWLAALDDRIGLAMTSGYFYGIKESHLLLPHNCSCNFIPYIYKTMDIGDIGALIAPKPFMIESGTNDHLNGEPGINNVYPQVEITRKAYDLFGSGDKLIHNVHDGKHEWRGIGILDFLDRHLSG